MSDEEIDNFLRGRHTMTVASLGKNGRPHLVAMWYGFFDDGAPGFWTFGKSQKIMNLRRDPRVTVLVETGDSYDQLQGVQIAGTATIIESEAGLRDVGRSVVERYFEVGDPADMEAIIVQTMKKRVAVKIEAESTVSWDHRKLGGRY
jgi:PPOX class probable F420-dependent enzyme